MSMMKRALFLSMCGLVMCCMAPAVPGGGVDREAQARRHTADRLIEHWGKHVFIRIIKEDEELELWLKEENGWRKWKTYPIAGMSGDIGPKEMEGDCQAPEGFYRVRLSALNPRSNYYLSFNIGYPNAYDRRLGRTGSLIMVHGSNVSIGCFAMTDPGIEEIYTLVASALRAGQPYVPVQVYPFCMTPDRMEQEAHSPHAEFWRHLQPGWQHTEDHAEPYPDLDND